MYKPSFRQMARPAVRQDQVADKYWYPKYQEWMSLTEYVYIQNLTKENNHDKRTAAGV